MDSTGTETWQIFSRMPVTAKNLKSCLPLLEMEYPLVLNASSTPVTLNARLND